MEVASTVTTLISKDPIPKQIKKENTVQSFKLDKSEYVGSYGNEAFYSSSKLLNKYIRDYDKNQVWDLAKALTNEHELSKRCSTGEKENEINKEIKLAKKLLGDSHTVVSDKSEDLESLTTDDLLASNPLPPLRDVDMNTHIPTMRRLKIPQFRTGKIDQKTIDKSKTISTENASSLHFSHIVSNCSYGYRSCASSKDHDEIQNTSISGESVSNLFSLNGTSYTPHRIKYGSLSRELRCQPQSTNKLTDIQSFHQDRGDYSPTPTNLLVNKSPVPGKAITIDAGRTPFRSKFHQIDDISQDTISDTSTEILLDCERSWEKTVTKTPVAKSLDSASHISVPFNFEEKSSDIKEFIKDCLTDDIETNLSVKPSGSVETLKNMLFTLQSISSHDTRQDGDGAFEELSRKQIVDGHSSLQRALSHLSNLKNLTS